MAGSHHHWVCSDVYWSCSKRMWQNRLFNKLLRFQHESQFKNCAVSTTRLKQWNNEFSYGMLSEFWSPNTSFAESAQNVLSLLVSAQTLRHVTSNRQTWSEGPFVSGIPEPRDFDVTLHTNLRPDHAKQMPRLFQGFQFSAELVHLVHIWPGCCISYITTKTACMF